MNPLPRPNVFHGLWRLWLTGALYLFAGAGFVFYGLLWVVRMMQTRVRAAVIVVLLVSLTGGGAFVWYCGAGRRGGAPVEVLVEPGQSLWRVARELDQREVVCSARALVAWMKLTGGERAMQAGLHRFSAGAGVFAAARGLRHAAAVESTVTVPEGLTIEQTARVLSEALGIDSAQFAAVCTSSALASELGLDASSLEGYLFPDTYRFAPDVAVRSIARTMVARFEEQLGRVSVDSTAADHLSRHEIVILASIVEKEATLASERTRIAGVFHNRLRRGIPLGADPTVRYALRKFSGPLRVSELKSTSPYNTRVHRGLPPGPICSPGAGALQAAAAPMQTAELYFVALWDGSGAHDFSRTLAEHERKKNEIRRRNEQRLRELNRNGGT